MRPVLRPAVLVFALSASLGVGPGWVWCDLLYDHFGVTLTLDEGRPDTINGGTAYYFAEGTFAPTRHADTVDYVVNDWHGLWALDGTSGEVSAPDAGQVPTGFEPYDVEALYLDDDAQNLYVVVVTSFDMPPGKGTDGPGHGNDVVVSGDLALDLGLNEPFLDGFSYDFGVDLNDERRRNSNNAKPGAGAVGNTLYRTENDDWYLGTPRSAVAGADELTNLDPDWKDFAGTELGEVTVSYYDYDFGDGRQECGYATRVIEVTLPRLLLPTLERGQTVQVSWVMGGRQDGSDDYGGLRFDTPPDIDQAPEPATLLLVGVGAGALIARHRLRRRPN